MVAAIIMIAIVAVEKPKVEVVEIIEERVVASGMFGHGEALQMFVAVSSKGSDARPITG
jgi:hypothetical protein